MKKRIVLLIICIVVVAQAVTMFAAVESFRYTYQSDLEDVLEGDINATELALDGDFSDLQGAADAYEDAYGQDMRITYVDADGNVMADSDENAPALENHANREEVGEARQGGFGRAVRKSASTGLDTIYVAKEIGGGIVLRMAMPMETTLHFVAQALPVMVITFIVLTVIALIVSGRVAKGVLAPMNQFYDSVRDYMDGETPTLQFESKYEELDELSGAFSNLAQRLNRYIARVRLENQKSALILDNIREGLMILDKDQDVLLINAAAREIFGASDDIANVNILHFVRKQAILNQIDRAYKKHKNTSFDIADEAKGRTYRYYLSFVPEEAFSKSGDGLLVLITDVTDALHADRVRRDFAANVSHELKTPLTSINGYAQLIANGMSENPDETRQHAAYITKEAERLMGLINDTLSLSELEQITMDEPVERVDIAAAANDVKEMLAQKLKEADIMMQVEGAAQATVNPGRVKQLLLNLCDNAIKYNKPGGSVEVLLGEEGEYAVIRVKDSGIGIPEEELPRVFERFYRAANAGGATVPGTGLGLAIAKHVAQMYDGSVQVESVEGEGSVFMVWLKKK